MKNDCHEIERHMPPVREDINNTSRQESLTETTLEPSLQFRKEEELAFSSKESYPKSHQASEMTHENLGACASSKPSRPTVTPGTTKENCKICAFVEDNVKTNFSFLKKDLDPDEVIDIIIEKKCITSNQTEDISSESKRRRKVDVLMKKLLDNGQRGCQCLIDAFLELQAYRFIPSEMHQRHLQRSKINIATYAIGSQHLNFEHDYIVDNMEPEEIADLLLEEYVISHLDHEEIINPVYHKSRRSMSKEMIAKLLKKDRTALNLFLYALENTEHHQNKNIARKLQSHFPLENTEHHQNKNIFRKLQSCVGKMQKNTLEKGMTSTKVSFKLSFTDSNKRALPDIEDQVMSIFQQEKDMIDDLADDFARLSIKDFEHGSIVIHLELESVNHVNRFRYAVTNGEVENFVNRLLEYTDIHKLIPKDGINVEVDILIKEEEDGSSEQVKEWSSAQRCVLHNMAYLVEELNPSPILKEYQQRMFLTATEIQGILQRTSRRLQVQTLLKIILSKNDSDVDNFFSILQCSKQTHIFHRMKSSRCADRCENVPYELYRDPEKERKERNHSFLNLLLNSDESLLIFDDVMFAAGLSNLIEVKTSAQRVHICSKGHAQVNVETAERHKKTIEDNFDKLSNYFAAPDIVVELVERGALTLFEKEIIMKEATTCIYGSNISLLNIITNKGADSCSTFADVLQEQICDQVVYDLFHVEYAGGGRIDEGVDSKPKEMLLSKPPLESSQIKVVAAIDFGTTYSGFAYSFIGETSVSKIKTKHWKANRNTSLLSLKTPSCLLLKKDKSFGSFGFEADEKYFDLAEEEEHHHWHYFKQFKMLLHNKPDLRRDTKIKDDQGHELTALDIFAHSIKYLKDDLLQDINKISEGKDIFEENITWVLTVPAIWDEPAKQFMREAAHQAGILKNRLALALEPEAAAIYVKQINIQRHAEESKSPCLSSFKPGTKFLVLDVGGGTVDATVTKVSEDDKLEHLHEASGGEWGGQKVNEAIHSLFEDIFGTVAMGKFKSENRLDHLELDLAIETSKRNVDSVVTNTLDIKIPNTLMEAFKTLKVGIDEPVIPAKYSGKVEIRKQRLKIDKGLFKELFNPCIENILKHTKKILGEESAKGVEYLICVGGFSECKYLKEELRENFPGLRVIIPHDAGLAVLKGAVLFGQTPAIIKSRICPFTYGTAMHRFFMKDFDDVSKLVKYYGQPYCKDVFHKLAEAGSSYNVGDKVETEVHPLSENMTKMSVKIYRSRRKNPIYVTDQDCSYLGRMVVDMPDTRGGLNRTVVVSITFGETEIMVEGLDKSSNKKVHYDKRWKNGAGTCPSAYSELWRELEIQPVVGTLKMLRS
ncbi:hypothetical protein KUTeg_024224, partial [Tegillarca granosa]